MINISEADSVICSQKSQSPCHIVNGGLDLAQVFLGFFFFFYLLTQRIENRNCQSKKINLFALKQLKGVGCQD